MYMVLVFTQVMERYVIACIPSLSQIWPKDFRGAINCFIYNVLFLIFENVSVHKVQHSTA